VFNQYFSDFVIKFNEFILHIKSKLKENNKYEDILFSHIKSIRDIDDLEKTFTTYNPDIVIHAAAYKHVYQMELNPDEAIKTDIL